MTGMSPDYRTGMRLVFFADNSTNPWGIHAFGNYDWHESAAPEYWYYYRQGDEKYPTTTGLSVQYISDILIYSGSTTAGRTSPHSNDSTGCGTDPGRDTHLLRSVCSLAACGFLGYIMQKRG